MDTVIFWPVLDGKFGQGPFEFISDHNRQSDPLINEHRSAHKAEVERQAFWKLQGDILGSMAEE